MHDTTRRIATWLRQVLAPGTDKRRTTSGTHTPATVAPPEAARPQPSAAAPRPPTPRSPYWLDMPLGSHEATLVRPYVLMDEREQERTRQRRRRIAMVLTADFDINRDRHVAGVEEVAR